MHKDSGSIIYKFFRDLSYYIVRLYGRIEFHGLENVPGEGSCILASNHPSFIDPPLLGGAMRFRRRAVRFLARDTLFKGVLGWILRNVHVIPLDPGKGSVSSMRKAITIMQEGGVVGIFPEGTRSLDGKMHPAKGGIGFLMSKAQVPIVPVYIDGAYRAMPKDARWVRRHRIRLYFGKPIPPEAFETRDLPRETYAAIGEQVMKEIARLRPEDAQQQ